METERQRERDRTLERDREDGRETRKKQERNRETENERERSAGERNKYDTLLKPILCNNRVCTCTFVYVYANEE